MQTVISLDHARKERKERYLSVMDKIWADIVNYMGPRGYSAMEMGEAFIRAERVIQGGGKVPDALYQAFKPLWDGPEAA